MTAHAFVFEHTAAACLAALLLAANLSSQKFGIVKASNNDNNKGNAETWLNRSIQFYHANSFNLEIHTLALLGQGRLRMQSDIDRVQVLAHLPFWFDYKLFKHVFNKTDAKTEQEETAKHHRYINTCVSVLKQRVLFRMLAGTRDVSIGADADEFRYAMASFGAPVSGHDKVSVRTDFTPQTASPDESPVRRAKRLVQEEMSQVDTRNQIMHYTRAFDYAREVDEVGVPALDRPLPFKMEDWCKRVPASYNF